MSTLIGALDVALAERERRNRKDLYWNDPVAWAKYMMGATLWSKQREISESVVYNKSVAVKAGHGVGKSFLVALLICWWVDTRYPNAFVASTAPSTAQIGAIVWQEIRKNYNLIEQRFKDGIIDHKLPGYINRDNKNNEWKDDVTGQLIGFGRKPPEGKEDDNFQGIHDAYVLAVGDEAVGLSGELIDALGNITSNEGSRRILIANPTNPLSYMGKIFREDMGNWTKHSISVLDSPHFTDEKKDMPPEVLAKLTGVSYVEEKKVEYGEDSPRYKARVLGEFSFDGGNTLIGYDDIAKALETEILPSSETQPRLGVDVARYGQDKSTVYSNHDGRVRLLDSWGDSSGVDTARRVHKAALESGAGLVCIDGTGVGGPIVDMVAELAENRYTVVAMYGSDASPDNKQWHNIRAYWWDDVRRQLREGRLDIDHRDQTLQDELMSPEYKFAPKGGLLIESKDDMARRGIKSPDFGDAMVYACADIEWAIGDPLSGMEPGTRVETDVGLLGQRDFLGVW